MAQCLTVTMARARRDDWLVAALALVQDQGPRALTLDRLCKQMGKTKGSFYHHFEDVGTLRASLLDRWESRQTDAFIALAEQEPDAESRARILDRQAVAADWGEERAIRTWAWHDPEVRERVDSVDRKRIAYLARLHPDKEPALARRIALVEYAALVGAMHLFTTQDGEPEAQEALGGWIRARLRGDEA